MSLKKYKVIDENENAYTIEHPSGKKLFIDKSGLSDKAHKEIQSLCNGGMLYKENKKTEMVPKAERFAYGGAVAADAPPEDRIVEQGFDAPKDVPVQQEQDPLMDPNSVPSNTNRIPADASRDASIKRLGMSPGEMNTINNTPENPLIQQKSSMQDLYQKEQQAQQEAMTGEAAATENIAKIQEGLGNQMSALPTQEQIVKNYNDRDAKLAQDFADKKIDPQRYMHNMGTGSKIAAGIGMVLSGIGSGITGKDNMAMTAINRAIDHDIDAQREDKSGSMTLWKMNREAMGNELAANLATRNQLLAATQASLAGAQARALIPAQKLRSQQAIDQIQQQMIQNNMMRSMLGAPGMSGAGGKQAGSKSMIDPAVLVGDMVKDEGQKKSVLEEIKNRSNIAQNGKAMLEAFDQAQADLSGPTGIAGAVLRRTPGQLKLEQLMKPNMSDLDGTIRHEAVIGANDSMIPSYKDLNEPKRLAEKRKTLIDWMKSQSSAPVSKSNLIDLDQYQKTAVPNFGSDIEKKAATGVKYMNGQPFKLGKDGNYHRVK